MCLCLFINWLLLFVLRGLLVGICVCYVVLLLVCLKVFVCYCFLVLRLGFVRLLIFVLRLHVFLALVCYLWDEFV